MLYLKNGNNINEFAKILKKVYEKGLKTKLKNEKNIKEKVVILGSGWGGINILKNIDFKKYDVTLISPRNYFTFTPLLPCVCSGTLSINACTESVHNFLKKKNSYGKFLQLECTDIIPLKDSIKCKDEQNNEVTIVYDYLIIAVGAKTNSFNIKGVEEYAYYIKDIEDALKIKNDFIKILEKCSLPNIDNEVKKKKLHIIVVGGGPTGVEVAGELGDFIKTEVRKNFENIFQYISLSIVEGGKKLLPTFSEDISKFTEKNLNNLNVNVLTNHTVKGVTKDEVIIQSSINKNETKKLNYGMIIWASGLQQRDIIKNLLKKIPEQVNNNILAVDSQLKVIGIPSNNIYAVGDCKKIYPLQLTEYTNEIIHLLNGKKITSDDLKNNSKRLSQYFPQLSKYKWNYDENKIGEMDKQQLYEYLKKIDNNYKSPAPTAQNARQEAIYISYIFNTYINKNEKLFVPSFNEKWKGSLAYIGNHEVVANLPYFNIKGGPFSFTFWQAVYIQMLLTWKSRCFFIFEFIKNKLHGRSFV